MRMQNILLSVDGHFKFEDTVNANGYLLQIAALYICYRYGIYCIRSMSSAAPQHNQTAPRRWQYVLFLFIFILVVGLFLFVYFFFFRIRCINWSQVLPGWCGITVCMGIFSWSTCIKPRDIQWIQFIHTHTQTHYAEARAEGQGQVR